MELFKFIVIVGALFFIFCFFKGCSRMKSINDSQSYYLKGNKIIYHPDFDMLSQELKNVDIDSFEPLSDYYAKDKYNVYYGVNIIGQADSATVKLLKEENSDNWSSNYIKDKNYIFYQTEIVEGADIETFIPLGTMAEDKNYLYEKEKSVRKK